MDYKKDIQKRGLTNQNTSNSMVIFGVNLSKKCERLATAIYLVTNFLSDTEPMKYRLRALSLELVRDASFTKNGVHGVEANVLERLHANIFETLSLFELAFIAGLVSEMNFTVLKREYVSLRDTIDIKKASRESHTDIILGDNFFSSQENVFASEAGSAGSRLGRKQSRVTTPFSKGHSIGQTNTTMSDRTPTKGQIDIHAFSSSADLKNPSPKSDLSVPASMHRAPSSLPNSIQKDTRRIRILKLIKDNREVAIKDIVAHFPDISEKTIQRELVSMSDSGVLKKFGERRWSRYALA
ncbi:MAG: DeoR family transcriptional regulator [Candidatus Yonathbacteria bacterium]|nr:DeoR family transcriptional regulator [Candidatus Yonathbacteria bacterium]